MKYEDTFTVKQLLHELNEYRRAMGEAPIKEWKASRAKLIERVKETNRAMLADMDPLAIPAFLSRRDPLSFINQRVTPEMQVRIDAAMAKARTAVVASSFAHVDEMRAAEKRVKLDKFKASRPQKGPKKEPPPADTFHLTSLGEGRTLRVLARSEAGLKFLKPLEVQKYVYRNADKDRIATFIKEKTS